MKTKNYEPAPPGWMYIFRKSITDPKTGVRRCRPNGKAFILLVPVDNHTTIAS